MDEATNYEQKILKMDQRMLARVKRLQVAMMITFEEAVKIVQISLLDDIKYRVDNGEFINVRII